MAGYDLPMRAIRQQVASALDLIIHLERMTDGSRKVTAITEVQHMEGDVITTQDLFVYRYKERHRRPLAGRRAPADGPAADVPRQAGAPRHPAARRSCSRTPTPPPTACSAHTKVGGR